MDKEKKGWIIIHYQANVFASKEVVITDDEVDLVEKACRKEISYLTIPSHDRVYYFNEEILKNSIIEIQYKV